jgi:predicted O-linked N-acetylglucosamine transferase (SPINDLY family)
MELCRLGQTKLSQGKLAEAAQAFRTALQRRPNSLEALDGLAQALLAQQPAEALVYLEKGLALEEKNSFRHTLAGDALQAQGKLGVAIIAYERALALQENQPRAWWGLGCVRLKRQEWASTVRCLRRAVELVPQSGEAWHNLGMALHDLGHPDEARAAMQRAMELLGLNPATLGSLATIIPECPSADPVSIRGIRELWARFCTPPVTIPQRRPDPQRQPLRLGYVSSFFQSRNWMKPVWGLLDQHNRERFAIHLFSDAPADKIQHGYKQMAADQFHDISGLSNEQAAKQIAAQEIDILVDLNGYSKPARLGLFTYRPAPVQVAWFNMYATTGMKVFQGLIGDSQVLLPGEEAFCTEPVLRLPGCYLAFTVDYPVPDVVPPPCQSGQPFTFGCMAPLYKLTPPVRAAFAQILQGCPGSRLLLKGGALQLDDNRTFLQECFAALGIAPERILIEGPAEHYAFLQRYDAIDLALDTFPYNGGTTTMEALWQGVPVLTFCGDRWVARISASLLHHGGLEEFIAPDITGFIQQAIAWGNDPAAGDKLAALRSTMREKLRQAPVSDCASLARSLEGEYERLWQQHCASVTGRA